MIADAVRVQEKMRLGVRPIRIEQNDAIKQALHPSAFVKFDGSTKIRILFVPFGGSEEGDCSVQRGFAKKNVWI